ncbi:N-acetylmuramoyl-L-alanine amidase [Enterococcus sp. 5H]|uniref:N-acetylmuramoyl-L-alanine amidase n=1 Tax=Enterococcus sp. 5H TaxID=1229490 RepID=UPI0023040733|nr:N-acetylmuramoyl-L-alanine amidase [Enterococcus sp. 5H]MDA9472631.1 putative lysin [Enterococcus sp. 5H]
MPSILLIAGHGAGDPGAVGNGTSEAVETRRVVNALVGPLQANGFAVKVYDQSKNAFAEAQAGRLNFGGSFDYVFEVHFNSFNKQAKGTEAYITTSESGDVVEQKVVSKLAKYFTNRGVKRTNFSVIYNAKSRGMSSCLYEVCFIDNAEDMAAYNNNFNSIITDMANGIAEGFGLSGNSTSQGGSNSGSSNTSNNQNTQTQKPKQQEVITMVCTFNITDKDATLYYYDGQKVIALKQPDQARVLRDVYRLNNGKEMPHFNWTTKAPWYDRLIETTKLKAV